ncbi:dihydrofolate reductase [Deinococcus irradiatisoli]|uniref:Dihydrofolate reductase n=2 Tax=Deinococcus irradiatisoli TaxID=2202254 RepID=A0A2Z3JKQ6_9DEIO|nr:dihydrofolate reductase [Deinococcus irradiatisoli]
MTPRLPFLLDQLRRDFLVHAYWEMDDPAAVLRAEGRDVRAVVTNGVVGCPREVVEALPNLGVICVGGVGLDAVDVTHAHQLGVQVTTTPGVLTADVADQAMALLLAASRQVPLGDRYIRQGGWGRGEDLPLTRRVSGKRAGIVGLGEIGKAIARRLSAFDMSVAYTGRREQPGQPYRFVADVVELAREVDVLVVSSSGGEGTRHLINAGVLEALGPQGILINIARGSVVDQEALIASLRSGSLGAAGLDVFADEPQVPAELKALDNVVLSPHAATRTTESRQDISRIVLANLKAFFAGEPLLTPVTDRPLSG